MANVAFVGAGAIGGPLATGARRRGHEVLVCDAAARVRARFFEDGFRVTERAADCGACDAVIIVVETGAQLESVVSGEEGLLAGSAVSRRPIVIVVSTVLPSAMARVNALLAPVGIPVLDAPVSGGAAAAGTGTLTVFVGGDAGAIRRAEPYLALLGSTIVPCGDLGSGQTVKIINNLVGLVSLYVSFESYMLGAACGVRPSLMAEALMQGTGATFWHADPVRSARHYRNVFGEETTIDKMFRATAENLDLAVQLGQERGVQLPTVGAVVERMRRMDARTAEHWCDFAARFTGVQ